MNGIDKDKNKEKPRCIKKPEHIKFYSKTDGVRIKVDIPYNCSQNKTVRRKL